MIICITGITGFVGSQITRSLHHLGHDLICLVRKKEHVPEEIKDNHKVIACDLTKEIDSIECDLLIHCAAMVSDKTLSFFLNKANIDGTRHVMSAVNPTAKVIFISCASVYNITQEVHDEDEEIIHGLLTPYGRSKLKAEILLQEEYANRDIRILRIQNLYGKRARSFLAKLIKIYNNGKVNVPGDLDKSVTLTSIDHLINVVQKFITTNWEGTQIYNVVDDHIYNLKEVILSILSAALNRDVEVNEKSEYYQRIIAGFRTVLVPGNHITQNSIDFLSRDHVLSCEKLKTDFHDLISPNFFDHLDEYRRWLTDNGVSQVLKSSSRIYWT